MNEERLPTVLFLLGEVCEWEKDVVLLSVSMSTNAYVVSET